MPLNTFINFGATWLWEQYGKSLFDKAIGELKIQWARFSWKDAERKYRKRLIETYAVTRLLGFPNPIPINEIFIDVHVSRTLPIQRRSSLTGVKRSSALDLLLHQKKALVIGKAGSGKTTLLKRILLLACQGEIEKTPIFVPLRDWNRVGGDLLDYILREFKICEFPDPMAFVKRLLDQGEAIVLLDGLDELSSSAQEDFIWKILDFERQYPQVHIILTSRPPVEYSFERFAYYELVEFDIHQIDSFAHNWFKGEYHADQFVTALQSPQNRLAFDLAHTPLFLAFLCLIYQSSRQFPHKKTDLLQEVLEIMWQKWDNSRLVKHSNPFKSQREFLESVSYLALKGLASGSYLLRREFVLTVLEETGNLIDPASALRDLISRGIIIEERNRVYSFSHTSIQEYLVAYYLWRHPSNLDTFAMSYAHEKMWENVWIMAASLYENIEAVDDFYTSFISGIHCILPKDNQKLNALLLWINEKAQELGKNSAFVRAFLLYVALAVECARSIKIARNAAKRTVRAIAYSRIQAYVLLSRLDKSGFLEKADIDIDIFEQGYRFPERAEKVVFAELKSLCERFMIDLDLNDVYRRWPINADEAVIIQNYLRANIVLHKTLDLVSIDKDQVESRILTAQPNNGCT